MSSRKQTRKGPKKLRGKGQVRRVKRIPPTDPIARDEGPRLILPASEKWDSPGLEHYLRLADIALGRKKKSQRATQSNIRLEGLWVTRVSFEAVDRNSECQSGAARRQAWDDSSFENIDIGAVRMIGDDLIVESRIQRIRTG